jgi:hypothetical protein
MDNHAKQNGIGWMETISEQVDALEMDWERLDDLMDIDPDDMTEEEKEEFEEMKKIAGEFENADQVRERIEEGPLSVQVRSGWYSPGSEDTTPEEFEILLSTGGPALRIIGDLDRGQPERPRLQYQDWGTPWTELHDVDRDKLQTWCACFYFGD